MFKPFLSIMLFLAAILANGQTESSMPTHLVNVTLSGVVLDKATGEKLPSAHIRIGNELSVAVVNNYGFFSISNNKGKETELKFQHLGYEDLVLTYSFERDSSLIINLAPTSKSLDSLTIRSDNTGSLLSPSNFKFTPARVSEMPSFAGEPDPLKALQFLPGVQSGNEGTMNFSVRGGSFDQNLFLLDEALVFNPSHALSFFSVFNNDAIKSISFYKNAIPVKYGGRLSSVVEMYMKEGNSKKTTVTGSVGTIASKLTVEGPLFKTKGNRLSYILSGRYSYAGQVVNGLYFLGGYIGNPTANRSRTDNVINFYDVNGKVNFKLNDRNHFYISSYRGHDNFNFINLTSGYSLAWGNQTVSGRWNHVHSQKLFSNSTTLFSKYAYNYSLLNNTQYFSWQAKFDNASIKQDYDYYPNNNNQMSFGWGVDFFSIDPGSIHPRDATAVSRTYSLDSQHPLGTHLYIGNSQKVGNIQLNYGLRYSTFGSYKNGLAYSYANGSDIPVDSAYGKSLFAFHRIDPRVSISFTNKRLKYSASYDKTTQYFHLLANSSVGLPTDVWLPSSNNVLPQRADIFSVTTEYLAGKPFSPSLSVYYKSVNHSTDFIDNADFFVNKHVESQLRQGTARAYGVEFLLQKGTGKLTGFFSYTLSKAEVKINGVNLGRPFPSRYDKRHNLSLHAKMVISKRLQASTNFVYTTGGAITVPTGNFVFDGVVFNYYTSRNSFKLPGYHRLDLSFKYTPKKNEGRKWSSFWSFDIYNVYSKKNPFTVFSRQVDNGFGQTKVSMIHLFGIVPSVTYSFKF